MDASDPKQVEKAIKTAKDRDARRDEALRGIMSTESGRLWLHDLLEVTGPMRTPFSLDPIQMAFNCGGSDVGLRLIADMHRVSTELYLQMMKENTK